MKTGNIHLGNDVDISSDVSLNAVKTGNRGKIRHYTILFGSTEKPLTIGDDFFIGTHCYLNGIGGLTIGNRVTIAHGSMLFTDSGPNTSPELQKSFPISAAPITIGNDVWIGARCTILPGVTIGDRCVIGAGSLVNADVAEGSVVAGTPASMIRKI